MHVAATGHRVTCLVFEVPESPLRRPVPVAPALRLRPDRGLPALVAPWRRDHQNQLLSSDALSLVFKLTSVNHLIGREQVPRSTPSATIRTLRLWSGVEKVHYFGHASGEVLLAPPQLLLALRTLLGLEVGPSHEELLAPRGADDPNQDCAHDDDQDDQIEEPHLLNEAGHG